MKKNFFLLVMLLFTCFVFSQKIMDKPDYGFSNLPGKLTKIELTDSATIIHFYIKYQPGQWIFIPKESYIQDVNGDEKQYVTKTIGIPLGERYTIPESGEVSYQLYFPKLKVTVNKVDFGEANEGDSWAIYDIVVKEQKELSVLPKELNGNWFQANGSNQWDYGFYANQAVVGQAVWNYKNVNQKNNNYTIVLERNGIQKTIYAQIDKKGTVYFGKNKEKLTEYSTEKVNNPNYKLANDEVYKTMAFKTDSTTYSGFIKGYTTRVGRKTGTIYVNNIFTGNQDSYLVKILDDGNFSVKFPITHPQFIFVSLPNSNTSVFVAPGNETFQVLNKDMSLFMGDCARVNTEFLALGKIGSYNDYQNLRTKVLAMSPEAYKKACLEMKNKQIQALNDFTQKQFISQKTIQIKKLDIEFLAYENILSYDMYRESAERNQSPKANPQENESEEVYKLDKSYYDFIRKSVLNNELALLAGNYNSFINKLRFAGVLRPSGVSYSYTPLAETVESLQKHKIKLSDEDINMAEESKGYDKIISKTVNYYIVNNSKIQKFNKDHKQAVTKLQKENPKFGVTVEDLATYLNSQGVALTQEENELLASFKLAQITKEEIAIQNQFTDKYGESWKVFNEKYKTNIQELADERDFKKSNDKLREVFGESESFVFDVMTLQEKSEILDRNMTPYTDNQLQSIQGNIKQAFLSNYIVLENDKIKSKVEANKSKTGFTVNSVEKTEGDELFESMIAKFRGKVIYVDFWATWCAPCIQGIKEIALLKEEMKNDDVIFLYITNPTSPENAWSNRIPDIKGEHYRVTQDEWKYLTQKFNISGIPHYVLVSKKGEIVNPKLGHNSNQALKRIIEEQM